MLSRLQPFLWSGRLSVFIGNKGFMLRRLLAAGRHRTFLRRKMPGRSFHAEVATSSKQCEQKECGNAVSTHTVAQQQAIHRQPMEQKKQKERCDTGPCVSYVCPRKAPLALHDSHGFHQHRIRPYHSPKNGIDNPRVKSIRSFSHLSVLFHRGIHPFLLPTCVLFIGENLPDFLFRFLPLFLFLLPLLFHLFHSIGRSQEIMRWPLPESFGRTIAVSSRPHAMPSGWRIASKTRTSSETSAMPLVHTRTRRHVLLCLLPCFFQMQCISLSYCFSVSPSKDFIRSVVRRACSSGETGMGL